MKLLGDSARCWRVSHLVVTLPLLAAVLSGTALGAFLVQNEALVFGLASAYFLAAFSIGCVLRKAKRRTFAEECFQCELQTQAVSRRAILVPSSQPRSLG